MDPRPHKKSTQMFSSIAEKFDVSVEPLDEDKWSAALTLAKALDNLVDDDHLFDTDVYFDRVVQGERIPHLSEEEGVFIRSTYEKLSDESQAKWQDSAAQLGAYGLKRIAAATIHRYMDVVRDESPYMANVLQLENDGTRFDQYERGKFNAWLIQAIRSFYVLDTASDFVKDHNEGNMTVPITPHAIAVLGRSALAESAALVRVTPPSVYPVFAQRTLTKIGEKARIPGFWSNQFIASRD